MATISLTIGSGDTARVIDALCSYGGYQALLPDGSANPVTKAAFAKSVLLVVVKDIVRNQERATAIAAAAATADADVT